MAIYEPWPYYHYVPYHPPKMVDKCPNCGYCPHCGRSNTTPYQPNWWYNPPTVTCVTVSNHT